jgi:hypothetical protein
LHYVVHSFFIGGPFFAIATNHKLPSAIAIAAPTQTSYSYTPFASWLQLFDIEPPRLPKAKVASHLLWKQNVSRVIIARVKTGTGAKLQLSQSTRS